MINEPIIVEQTVNAATERVWKALTDLKEMHRWYFDISEFEPKLGFKFHFTGGTEEKRYLHLCEITSVVPNKQLAYSWRYDGYAGDSLVTFDLIPEGAKTLVRLTHKGVETFPSKEDRNFARESFVAGWTDIIKRSLKEYVEA